MQKEIHVSHLKYSNMHPFYKKNYTFEASRKYKGR